MKFERITRVWIIYDDLKRGADYYRFYPCVQPEGDYGGVDSLKVYIAPAIRAQLSDETICQTLAEAMLMHGDGCENLKVGHVNVHFDYYGDAPTNTISMDDDGSYQNMLSATAGNA